MNKNETRKKILEVRGKLSEGELTEKSDAIFEKVLESSCFQSASLIMCYVDFRNEVKTGSFISECLRNGRRLALPVIESYNGRKELIPYEIKDPSKDLSKGTYGIMEPIAGAAKRIEPGSIDLVIVPGVAFDIKKHRMGYGAGYYDRFLGSLKPACVKVGVAFDIQVLDEIPVEAHDFAMDLIITERRIIR